MKAFLLAERSDYPYGDGILVVAQNQERARKLAAQTAPRFFAPDGKNLWESEETACIEFGEIPEADEGAIMKGSVLLACAVENDELRLLRLK